MLVRLYECRRKALLFVPMKANLCDNSHPDICVPFFCLGHALRNLLRAPVAGPPVAKQTAFSSVLREGSEHLLPQRCDSEGRVSEEAFNSILMAELQLLVDYKVGC